MAYTYTPPSNRTDLIAELVRHERTVDPNLPLSIAKFYEYSARRAIEAYRQNPAALREQLKAYLQQRNNSQ